MLVFFGTRLYGKVDQVPGLFHLATQFFYLQFVPLVPLRSYLVFEGTEAGLPLGLSGKSVLFAYLRVALILSTVVAAVLGLVTGTECLNGRLDDLPACVVALVVAAGCGLLFWASYRLAHARPLRAVRLAIRAGISVEVMAEYYAKRLSSEEFEQLVRQTGRADEPPPAAEPYA